MLWALMAEQSNKAMEYWAISLAFGMAVTQGQTHAELAAECGETESNFSKRVNYYCDLFQLPRPRSCKSQEARGTYSRVQRADHWRDRTGLDYVRRKCRMASAQ
jgi:hypothetical protein